MHRRFLHPLLLFTLALSLLFAAGCQPAQKATPEATLASGTASSQEGMSVEGRLVPKDSVHLSFVTSGQVEEVLVAEGDLVQAGQVIARYGNREQLEAAIANARTELLAAQQAHDDLFDNLKAAQNDSLQTLNIARQVLKDAEEHLGNISGEADDADIDIAHSQVVFAKNALEDAQDKYKRFQNLPEDNLARARYRVVLNEKQKAYDAAVRHYNSLVGSVNDFDRKQAQTDVEIARNQLDLAQADFDLLQKGPDPKKIAAAQSRIDSAKAQLSSAESNLKNLELHTPIGGKIVELNLKVGEEIAAGAPVAQVADSSEWFVETDNLTEIDVVNVEAGQAVKLVPDALPDLELDGQVVSIKDVFEEKRGDVTYTVRIRVQNPDPRLRWGMTIVTNFEEG